MLVGFFALLWFYPPCRERKVFFSSKKNTFFRDFHKGGAIRPNLEKTRPCAKNAYR
jgi:hypothetical protein